MKTFKRLFSLLLALMMAFTLFGCDGEKGAEEEKENGKELIANTPEELIGLYYEAVAETDIEKGVAVLNAGVLSYYSKGDKDMNKELTAELKEELRKYEEDYGENIRFEYTVTDKFSMPEEYMAKIVETYTDSYNLDTSGIEEGVVVEFELTVKSDTVQNSGTGRAYVIKENGQWKVYDLSDTLR